MESQEQLNGPEKESQEYSVPWKPMDNWIGIFLLVLVNIFLLLTAYFGYWENVAQSAALVLAQLAYFIPVLVVFAYRRVSLKAIGFGMFEWSALALGCGLVIASNMIIFVHNMILIALGIETQAQEMMGIINSLDSAFWFIFVVAFLAPLVEEIFFRGFLFQGFRQRYGWVTAVLLSSAVFSAAHLSLVMLIPAFILGCVLAYMYHRTNSVWPGVILHFLINSFGVCALYFSTKLPELIPV